MGGPWELMAHGPPDRVGPAAGAVFHEIGRIESLLSRFRPDSEIARINRLNGQGPGPAVIRIEPEVFGLVAFALEYAERTGGAFDPTAGALSRLWGFGPGGPGRTPPDEARIRGSFRTSGYRHLVLDLGNSRITFRRIGLELDLGAVGKGYAVDRAVEILKSHGIERAWIGCGSTGYALGAPPNRVGWRIGIRDPLRPECMIRTVPLRDRAISSSGAYERFTAIDGKRIGHIFDPRTGFPAAGGSGVTVTASTAAEADILSTAAFVMGVEAGLPFLESLDHVEACFAGAGEIGGRIRATSGWNGSKSHDSGRRRFLTGLLAALGLFALKPFPAVGAVYLTEEEALRGIMPDAVSYHKDAVTLTAEQEEKAREILGKRIGEGPYTLYRAMGAGREDPIGYGVVLDVIGKERPITFMVGIGPRVEIIGLEVLVYRESQGSEIRSKRFMKQFIGKTLRAPLKLGRDIDGISGATLSSRSTAYAVKKALAITRVVYGLHGEGGE